jgi:protocatechuate 3,4-dioxygenase beta subunit
MRKLAILFAVTFSASLHAAITGTVVDASSKPVSGATIRAYVPESSAALRARLVAGKGDPEPVATAQSAENGTFSLDVKGATAVDVTIEAPGRHHTTVATIDGDDLGALILGAPPSRMLRVTSGGKPVANAAVVSGISVTHTNAAGEVAPPVIGFAYIVAPGFAVARRESASVMEIALNPGVAVKGRVISGAGPVPHAIVSIDGWPLAESADDGTFSIAHAPQNWRSVSAIRGNDLGAAQRPKTGAVEIRIAPGSTFAGTLRDSKRNTPLAGARMTLTGPDDQSVMAVSDAKGSFTFAPLLPRTYAISGVHPAYVIEPASVTLPATRTRAFAAQALAHARGRVIDEERKPIASAIVTSTGNGTTRVPAAITNAAGEFDVRVVPALMMPLSVYASKRDYVTGASESRMWQPGEVRDNLAITLVHGFVAQVRVIDKQRQPVPNAFVNLLANTEGRQRFLPVACADPERGDCRRTGDDGIVSLRTGEGLYDVTVTGDDIPMVRLNKQPLSARAPAIVVNVERGIEINGRVVLPDGTPAVGAIVETTRAPLPRSATTAADGTFKIAGIASGPTAVTAFSADRKLASQPVSVNAPAKDVTVRLPLGARIEGRVFDRATQQPITDFTVSPSTLANRGMYSVEQPIHADDGHYVLDNVTPGVAQIHVRAAGYVPGSRADITVEDGKTVSGIDIPLDRGAAISGRVTSAGQPVAGVQVREPTQTVPMFANVTTDADGMYAMDGVAAGDHTIEFQKQGFVVTRKEVEVTAAKDVRLDAELDAGKQLTGRVVDSSGHGVAMANVFVTGVGRGGINAPTDGDGSFTLQGLADGKYTVMARKQGFVSAQAPAVEVPQAAALTLTLDTGATITGRVTGIPPEQLPQVTVTANGAMTQSQATPDASGNFTLHGLPEGRVRVDAFLMAGTSRRIAPATTIVIENGTAPNVEINFEEGITLSGRVTRSGVPLAGGGISFASAANPSQANSRPVANAMISLDGTYTASGLALGDYQVRINGQALSYQTRYTVSGSGTFDVDIKGATLRGRVVDAASGAPMVNVRVGAGSTTPSAGSGGGSAVSDSDGRFAIDALSDGTYNLRADHEQYTPVKQQVVISNGAATEIELRMEQAPAVTLRLVDASGAVVDGYVSITDGAHSISSQPMRVDTGTFKTWLKPGTYAANVFARGYLGKSTSFTTPPSEVTITLEHGGALVVRAGSAQQLRLDQLSGAPQRFLGMTHPGSNGPYDSIPPGSYVVSTIGADRKVIRSVPVTIVTGQTVTVDVP